METTIIIMTALILLLLFVIITQVYSLGYFGLYVEKYSSRKVFIFWYRGNIIESCYIKAEDSVEDIKKKVNEHRLKAMVKITEIKAVERKMKNL